jgi:hypothetical protein
MLKEYHTKILNLKSSFSPILNLKLSGKLLNLLNPSINSSLCDWMVISHETFLVPNSRVCNVE